MHRPEVIDGYPSHHLTWIGRLHRGFAALASCLVGVRALRQVAASVTPYRRFHLEDLDNLRRNLLPPALVTLLAAGWLVLQEGQSLDQRRFWCCFSPPTFTGGNLTNRIRACAWHHLRQRASRCSSGVLLTSAFLCRSHRHIDAIGRTLIRIAFSKRHLLEWGPRRRRRLDGSGRVLRRMWPAPALAVALGLWLRRPTRQPWVGPRSSDSGQRRPCWHAGLLRESKQVELEGPAH